MTTRYARAVATDREQTYPHNIRSYVGAVVTDSRGRYLLERHESSRGSVLTTFGGGTESGEDVVSAIVRELHEELGLRVEPAELTWVTSYEKTEPDGSTTHCEYFALAGVPDNLCALEGVGVEALEFNDVVASNDITPAARFAVSAAKIRAGAET
jgi:ADP-ribose pyrophosphatase YjhB (NUDIX family)